MLPLLLVVAVAALGLYLLARAFLFANPRALALGVRYGGYGLGAAVFLFMAMRGELGPLLALSALVVPLLARARRRAAAARPRGGLASQVETLYLRMSLDHDSGAMGGEVLHGPFKGRTLDQLAPAEASVLLDDCRRDDPQSAAVLEAWLDRTHPDWRERFAEAGPQPAQRGGGTMSREEAYEILGLSPGASADQVRQAHRRLMMGVHPDHGGSTYLAAKINQAKDLLLRP